MTDFGERIDRFSVARALSLEAQEHLAGALLDIIAAQGSEAEFGDALQAIDAAHEYENELRRG